MQKTVPAWLLKQPGITGFVDYILEHKPNIGLLGGKDESKFLANVNATLHYGYEIKCTQFKFFVDILSKSKGLKTLKMIVLAT